MTPGVQRLALSGGVIECEWIPPRGREGALVFLHEGLGCRALWRGWPAALAGETGFGALVASRYGYGGSDSCALPRPLSYMHEEALVLGEILERLPVEEAALIGHSDGGSIALIYAGSAPRPRLRGVVTLAAHVFCEDISVRSIAEARRAFEDGDLRARLERYHGGNTEAAFWGWNGAWLDPGFRSWNLEEYLPGIAAPLLAIQGTEDEYGTWAQVEAIVHGAPRARALSVPGGHWPWRDQEARCREAILAFLAEVWSEPGPGV